LFTIGKMKVNEFFLVFLLRQTSWANRLNLGGATQFDCRAGGR